MQLYFCEDQNVNNQLETSGAWLSESFNSDLEVCRLASSEEVENLWQPAHSNFDEQILELSDGMFTASISDRPYRGNAIRKFKFVVLFQVDEVS